MIRKDDPDPMFTAISHMFDDMLGPEFIERLYEQINKHADRGPMLDRIVAGLAAAFDRQSRDQIGYQKEVYVTAANYIRENHHRLRQYVSAKMQLN